jgi:hypothetical protein
MKCFALPLIAVLASGLALGVTSASAQTSGGAAACAKNYKDFWDNLDSNRSAKMSAEQFADLSRTALRGYDSCTAGDERFSANTFWKRLEAEGYSKASDILKSGAFDPAGAAKK